MYPSSTLCRTQEAHQLALASGTSLDNVRRIAERAATAWANEALVAERREARHAVALLQPAAGAPSGATIVLLHPVTDEANEGDRFASENPDRGFAD